MREGPGTKLWSESADVKALGSETASELKLPNVNLGADADKRELGNCAKGAVPAGLAGAAVKACG